MHLSPDHGAILFTSQRGMRAQLSFPGALGHQGECWKVKRPVFKVTKLWEIAKLGSKLNQIHKLNLSCKDTKNKDIPHKELRDSFNIIRVSNVIIKMKTKQIKLTSFLAGAIHTASDTGLNTGIASFSINLLHP